MRVIAVIQARMSSRRLPGKILRTMAGKPMLAHLFERVQAASCLDGVILATSVDPSDDPAVAWANGQGIACWRGPLDDVLDRIRGAAASLEADALVRLCGDSPLMRSEVIERAVALFRDSGVDLVTNLWPRSFPKGQSVEVVSMAALARIAVASRDPEDREHATRYFYSNPGEFRILNFSSATPRPDLQMSVDDPDDFVRVEAVIAGLGSGFAAAPLADLVVRMDQNDA